MAPKFTSNMYKIWRKNGRLECLICFEKESVNNIFNFRDILTLFLIEERELKVIKEEGEPTEWDSCFYFFGKDKINYAMKIYPLDIQKHPGILHQIFKTQKYKDFLGKYQKILKDKAEFEEMADLIIYTSHDHPCIEIYGKIDFEVELNNYIKKASLKLGIKIYKNENLDNIPNIICSNKTYSI